MPHRTSLPEPSLRADDGGRVEMARVSSLSGANELARTPHILADHCVAETTVHVLRGAGHTVHRLVDVMGPNATDENVVALAARHGWILLTEDRHFRTRVNYRWRRHAGVILLRDTQTHRETVHRRLLRVLALPPCRLMSSLFVIDRRSCHVVPTR
ncbi:MAG: DUF5615 family PIN-like protein [Armatimonadota bacterium]|nr:DUF5615 family PIN-like protein [Armatimonadota bacterium]